MVLTSSADFVVVLECFYRSECGWLIGGEILDFAAGHLLDLIALMDDFSAAPITASYILVSMHQTRETEVA
ncbi:unnamed protein product [Arabis nemorensis]|uniref:Uncharacterized protein n=1 Tax=Arabis nemorensis TaxID=586526 RepID=A0A565AY64_9BRAS|nr:unnamed protein product [Arabis nemorensis]